MVNKILEYVGDDAAKMEVLEGLGKALDEMCKQLYGCCESESTDLSSGLTSLIESGGKRLRPSLAWICARMGRKKRYKIVPLMSMLELMHTASLVHDDIVDEGIMRRGIPTINHAQGNLTAIKAGDYLLGGAMEFLPVYKGTGINEALSWVSHEMCLGELQQMEYLYEIQRQSVDRYFEQIKRKTAYLLATSCYTGALVSGMPKKKAQALKCYGEQIGIAFQLRDDLLDYVGDKGWGKDKGQDLKRGLLTMPARYAFRYCPDEEIRHLAEKPEKTDDELKRVFDYVCSSDGIICTEVHIKEASMKAVQALSVFEDSLEKEMLIALARGLSERTY